jgi:hypothetical protein
MRVIAPKYGSGRKDSGRSPEEEKQNNKKRSPA